MSGIYIHIPFCKQACHYCDFHFSTSLKKKDELIQALAKELILRKEELKDEPVETIYFGGGTPSLLSMNELSFVLDTVYENYSVVDHPEITLEANPDDITEKLIVAWSQSPINRLSIGIQSFLEADLKLMNRAHSSDEAKRCLEIATTYFENITIDLIYGVPGMSLENWNANLQTAINFGVPHISSYALTVEPRTALASMISKGDIAPVDDDMAETHYKHLLKTAIQSGYEHYETSNFAKPGFISKHNSSYWKGKTYIGIGPSAHSFSKDRRSWNVSNNSLYIKGIENNELPSIYEILGIQERYNEYIMTGLRTIWGISLSFIATEFGQDYKTYVLNQSQKYISQGLMQFKNDQLIITPEGEFLADGIASALFKI